MGFKITDTARAENTHGIWAVDALECSEAYTGHGVPAPEMDAKHPFPDPPPCKTNPTSLSM